MTFKFSYAQQEAEVSQFTVGTTSALNLKNSQLKALTQNKGLTLGGSAPKQLSNKFTGQGVGLDSLSEKEILELWQVLTAEQRDLLAKHLSLTLPVKPQDISGTSIPLWKRGPSPYHIPPNETTAPPVFIRNGIRVSISQIRTSGGLDAGASGWWKAEADACESASTSLSFYPLMGDESGL